MWGMIILEVLILLFIMLDVLISVFLKWKDISKAIKTLIR